MTRNHIHTVLVLVAGVFASFGIAHASAQGPANAEVQAPTAPASVTLFQNVRIFDGKSDKLTEPMSVLVRGNIIEIVSVHPIPTDRRAGAWRRRHVTDCREERGSHGGAGPRRKDSECVAP